MKLFKIKKSKLHAQIGEYIVWKSQIATFPESNQRDLYQIDKISQKADISLVTTGDLELYREYLLRAYNGHYSIINGMKEVRCILRYYRSRKVDCLSPDTISNEGFVLINEDSNSIIENMKEIIENKKKNVGGRGKEETVRNTAIVILRREDGDMFTPKTLGEMFGVSSKRICQITKALCN